MRVKQKVVSVCFIKVLSVPLVEKATFYYPEDHSRVLWGRDTGETWLRHRRPAEERQPRRRVPEQSQHRGRAGGRTIPRPWVRSLLPLITLCLLAVSSAGALSSTLGTK